MARPAFDIRLAAAGMLGISLLSVGCKRSAPTLLDDLNYFSPDTTIVARVDFTRPAAAPQWQQLVLEATSSENASTAIANLTEGCETGLLGQVTTLTIGAPELRLSFVQKFLWVLRGGFSEAAMTACLERRASTSGASPVERQVGRYRVFQYRPDRWAAVAGPGLLISGGRDSLEAALLQDPKLSLANSAEFQPILRSWDGQDIWAGLIARSEMKNTLLVQKAWAPASASFSHAILLGQFTENGLSLTVDGRLGRPTPEAQKALRDYFAVLFPHCPGGTAPSRDERRTCFPWKPVGDGIRLQREIPTQTLAGGVRSWTGTMRRKAALLVVGATSLTSSDQVLSDILKEIEFDVQVVSAEALQESSTQGKTVVVVSESVESNLIGDRLRDVAVGIVSAEPSLFDDLGLTGPTWAADYGDAASETAVIVPTTRHKISRSQEAVATLTSAPAKFVWGKPTGAAMVLAHLKDAPQKAVVFALESGEDLVGGGKAAGRRVAIFPGRDVPQVLTEAGRNFILKAIAWAAEREELKPGYLVVGKKPLAPGDIAISYLLTEAGVRPKAINAQEVSLIDSAPRRLVAISESVDSATVAESLPRDVTMPLLVMEPSLFDDLGMTGDVWRSDFGDAVNSTVIKIVKPADPLAAGLTDEVEVLSSPEKLIWGKPSNQGTVVATLRDSAEHAAVFYYRRGQAMAKGVATGTRVGLFFGSNAATQTSLAGARLFINAVRVALEEPPALSAMLVVGERALSTSDAAMSRRLEGLGMQVSVVLDTELNKEMADTADVLVVSESSLSLNIAGKLRDTTTGVVLLEVAALDETGMTGNEWKVDQGDLEAQDQIRIKNSDHPLASGLSSGAVTISHRPGKILWAKPVSSAVVIATAASDRDKVTIFAYEKGSALAQGTAPARRVGWFAGRQMPENLTPSGWQLFDSAVVWAAQR